MAEMVHELSDTAGRTTEVKPRAAPLQLCLRALPWKGPNSAFLLARISSCEVVTKAYQVCVLQQNRTPPALIFYSRL